MARIDDYLNAKTIACDNLKTRNIEDIARITGFYTTAPHILKIPFLNRVYQFSLPECEFTDCSGSAQEIPLQEQVLLLHYLQAETIPPPSDTLIAYREIPGAAFYFSAFVKRAIDPLKKVFGDNLQKLEQAALKLNGQKIPAGDAGFHFLVLPKLPLQIILWEGDDEFPSEANVLFDENIGDYLSPEDAAWLAGMLVYRLIALS